MLRSTLLLAFLVALLDCARPGLAQPTETAALDAPRPVVVMNLAAHPDDEDGATLTYYRHAKDAVAYSVIYTRGEGGQNEIGPELYDELGAIRTVESEQAARHLGTQLYFLNFYDFGYSKSAVETFERWGGRDAVTARLVYLIRKLKPDVLFTNHDTVTVGPRRQHGHHQAVGISAYDAFALAADSTYHPEQLAEAGVDLWQPKRLFLRLWRSERNPDVTVPVGATDPETGQPYAAYAAEALREHASQGMEMWADRIRGLEENRFVLLRSATDAPLAPDDLAGNLPPNRAADPPLTYYIDAGRIDALPDDALTLEDSLLVPGQTVRLRWTPGHLPARRLRWTFHGAIDTTLFLSDTTPGLATLTVDANATPSIPRAKYQYERFRSRPPVHYAAYLTGTDSLLAAGYLPAEIVPLLHLEAAEPVVRLHPGINRLPVELRLFDPAATTVTVNLAVSRDADDAVLMQQPTTIDVMPDVLTQDTLTFRLPTSLSPGDYTLTLTGLARPALRTPNATHAHIAGRVFDVEVPPDLTVGVVQSYDDALDEALTQLGIDHVMLDSLDLAQGALDTLDTIVIDIRAYLVRPDLRAHNDRLLDWVKRGGHLVVNYQKTFEWNAEYDDPFDASRRNPGTFAPYPLTLGRDRVTRETAPITVQQPDHPLFNTPNAIGPEAWDHWVQERGLYFPATYDDAYQELLCTQDPGEQPLCSSTLLADVGEGTYLYTALVWYRQLKAFRPGAYALFANMMSLPLVDDTAP
jgi:LmbE family N-acetylglucosaminyl deacetylase